MNRILHGHYLTVALRAAYVGGDVVMRHFRDGVVMRSKHSYNLVSDADVEAEHAIAEEIRRDFPDHEILGEEANVGNPDAEHLWIIDPLDGTNNFAHGVGHFAVSIAYLHRGQPIVGVVLNPVRQECFHAIVEQGAWCNGRRLQVSNHQRLDQVLVGVGFYYDRGEMMRATLRAIGELFGQNIHGIRRFGTASLDLCLVATGSFGLYFEYELAPWDFAAGRLIVEEAGGRVTTCTGAAVPVSKTSIFASNGHLHPIALPIIQSHLPASSG